MTQSQEDSSTSEYIPYKTSDTPFAAYLHYHGKRILGSKQDPNDYKREVLYFLLDDRIPELEHEWQSGSPMGELKRYHRSLKIVNRYVMEQRQKRA